MRNLKKLLAVIVAICVLASFTVPAFAAGSFTYEAQAKNLYDMGLFKGLSASTYVPNLEGSLTREAGTALLVRLFGVEADALALTDADTVLAGYTDAKSVSSWAKKYVAYAVKTGLVEGTTTTTLSPSAALTGNTVATIILRKLGFTVAAADFSKAAETLVTKGGIKADEATKFASKELIRDDAVGMMFGSLLAKFSTGETVIAKLVAAKVVTEAAAIAAGVWTAAPAVPAVASITGTNLKELTVVFTSELDETIAETVGNYTIAGVAPVSATLGADKKTVTLVVPDANIAANGAAYAVVVKKAIANTALTTMAADYSTSVRIVDNVLPDATTITLTGPQTFDITFNEPILTAGTVKVNNGIYGVTKVTTGTTITVTLAASQLPDANYTINLSGFKDYAGYAMVAEDMTLAYAKATDAITASITSATQTKVVVAFNRPVKLAGSPDEDYFYQTYSAWKPTTVTASDAGKTWTVEFDKYFIAPGSTNLVVKYTANGTAITDYWGNALAADIVLPLTVVADVTAPTVNLTKSAATDEDIVKIYFSEDMNKALAETETNFVVKDSAGAKVTTSFTNTYTLDSTNSLYYVTMDFASDLTAGNYTVELSNQTDASLAANKLATIAVPFTITDLTAINPASVTVSAIAGATNSDSEIFYVTFPDKVATTGQYSALSGDNYILRVFNTANSTSTTSSITSLSGTLELFGSSGKVVKITIANIPGFGLTGTQGADLTIGRIADLSNNIYTYPLSTTIANIQRTALPSVTAVRLTDYNKVSIYIDKLLTSVIADAFEITGTAVKAKVAGIESWGPDSDGTGTIVKATLTADTVTALAKAGVLGVNYTTQTSITIPSSAAVSFSIIGEFIVSEAGQKATNATIATLDYRAPVMTATTTNGAVGINTTTSVAISFSESLDATDAYLFWQRYHLYTV